jgi:hypothetical protein
MKEILDKITSYNLFNYLLPGVLFVAILDKFTTYSLHQDDLIVGAFVYYFVGLVISRFGSLVIEPILKKVSFVKFANYVDFVSASKKDLSIEIFSEVNNMYRTFVATFILIVLFKCYELLTIQVPILNEWSLYILIAVLLVMFLFSYRKQTQYITKRITIIKD